VKRVLLVVALVLVMAAVAAPSALASPVFYYRTADYIVSTPSKQSCEQARAADPAATSEKCSNAKTL